MKSLVASIDPNAPAGAVNRVGFQIAQPLLNAMPSSPWDPAREAEEFHRQGRLLSLHTRSQAATAAFETAHALQQIDGLVSASFSLLKAGTSIHPHYGDTNAIIRSHFGVDVPAGLPQVGFRVNGEERAWRNGEFLFFCDGYVHSAWNHSEKDRIVMIIDVLRPEFAARRRFICATVLASLTLQMMVSRARPLWGILLFPFFLAEALLSICAYGLSPVFNVLSKIFGGKGRGLGRNQRSEENIPER